VEFGLVVSGSLLALDHADDGGNDDRSDDGRNEHANDSSDGSVC
jgi:hypothetical protein